MKALATPENPPGREWMRKNGDLLDLIDRYDAKLEMLNVRMGEIRDEIDSCENQAQQMNKQGSS